MNVLVTGAAGFIGSHFAETLSQNGYQVTGVDNLSSYYDPELKQINVKDIQTAGVHFIKADLLDDLSKVLSQDYDYIFHFAAQPGISENTSFEDYERNNVIATKNLLDWTLKASEKCKLFVYISTTSVYGLQATVSEDAEPQPASHYGKSKLVAEQLVMNAHRYGQLDACSIRLFSVYGPRERPEKLYTKLIKTTIEGTSFPLYKNSDAHERSFTYVGDIVKGLIKVMLNHKRCNGEIINLGCESVHTTGEGIALIEKIIGKSACLVEAPERPGDQLKTAANITKAKELLSYTPETTLEQGLRAQVVWYKNKFC